MATTQQQKNQTVDESVEAARRMRQMTEEAAEAGANTLVELDKQGEQLDRTQRNLNTNEDNIDEIEDNLDDLNKCCGLCLCGRSSKTKSGKAGDVTDSSRQMTAEERQKMYNEKAARKSKTGSKQRGTHEDPREAELDECIDDTQNMVSQLKYMAQDMGTELDKQNKQIDKMDTQAGTQTGRLKHADDQGQKLLKS